MTQESELEPIRSYFQKTLDTHGASPRGVDWNSEEAREPRFEQLAKIIQRPDFSLLDYGCGYGAFLDYLAERGFSYTRFIGYDILDAMIMAARDLHAHNPAAAFTSRLEEVTEVDYAVACGVFNMKQAASFEDWTQFTLRCLHEMNRLARYGFSANFLTKYSDPDRMRPDLYYADPCFLFDYAKTHFSRNVAILHDYNLYDFTLLVRK